MNLIYVGIDGTGPEWMIRDPQYAQDFSDSHVSFLRNHWVSPDPFYNRGPTLLGFGSGNLAELAYSEVKKRVKKLGEDAPIFLAGYSRGGAIVIETAMYLKARDGINVKCLTLFDPVDRSATIGGPISNTPIVDTVEHVIYAKRSRRAFSRESFSNCGTVLQDSSKTHLYKKSFHATHGGLGGVPHVREGDNKDKSPFDLIDEGPPDFRTAVAFCQDRAGSDAVRMWMQNYLFEVISQCSQEQAKTPLPSQPSINPVPGGRPGNYLPPTGSGQIHVVKSGDWLSKIAQQYYGDVNKWRNIYNHPENKRTIGPNPDVIHPGQRLVIP